MPMLSQFRSFPWLNNWLVIYYKMVFKSTGIMAVHLWE